MYDLSLHIAAVLSIPHPVKWMKPGYWQFVMWHLGSCSDWYEQDYSLNNAPSAYDSVCGVHKTAGISSGFEVLILQYRALEKATSF